ncbi:alpha-galactosidase [Talaromyces proteolyticus]|uniref:Alpha-galactosidase n=1 Tax=Talaromyces proteolyticus TaxID=1131652 RepID=A0AAD4L0Q6_9EURO|nr:alpha-galactosidase [Talaromyces proteolyticus]KAH8701996.1 alpha-galactosidase [Talaromyces proteolyticus]
MIRSSIAAALLLSLEGAKALTLPDNVGRLPALGWNSWNAFGCDVSETKLMTAANEIVSTGLKDLGYEYVNIDDCWSVKGGRDNVTDRIIPDSEKFPSGINGTAQKIHNLGLKIGIYSSAGTETCAGYPASIGHESLDAQTFADWGIDYLKYDNCYVPSNWTDEYTACTADSDFPGVNPNGTCPGLQNPAPAGYDWSKSNTAKRYNIMRDALAAVEDQQVILFSMCEWGQADVVSWGNGTGNSWRMSGDINATWPRITAIANLNAHELSSVDFWGHNDPDMLEVGNGNLTIEENRAHFALWAIMKSPLIIGTALDSLPETHLEILKNADLVAFNQDPVHGKPAYPYKAGYSNGTWDPVHPPEYWSGSTSYGWNLVLLFNSEDVNATRTASWSEVPQLKQQQRHAHKTQRGYQVEDIWTGKDLGCVKDQYSVDLQPHDVAVLKIKGKC